MNKEYTSLGLMSGTSGDGVDASIIKSDGDSNYQDIENQYFEYDNEIYEKIHSLKEKVSEIRDLQKFGKDLNDLERKITLFHANVVEKFNKNKLDLVGFHGQTIFHDSQKKVSKQLGDGKLLSQLTKKNIVYNFRQNDIKNGGEGAPLTPIFHQIITTNKKIDLPVCILNIGGISNITIVKEPVGSFSFTSRDIGPGNCLIDSWVRKNSKKKFDEDGSLAAKGNRNEIIFEQAQELFSNRPFQNVISFDVNDFDVSFVRGLSLEDGATTLTDFTASIISSEITSILSNFKNRIPKVLICGGGRKNKILIEKIRKNTLPDLVIQSIDDYGIDGDFVESKAFAFLAIRSIKKLPISFPDTTGCEKPVSGGEIIEY